MMSLGWITLWGAGKKKSGRPCWNRVWPLQLIHFPLDLKNDSLALIRGRSKTQVSSLEILIRVPGTHLSLLSAIRHKVPG